MKDAVPRLAADDAGAMGVQGPSPQNEANSFLNGSRTEPGHRAGDVEGPGRGILRHFVNKSKLPRFPAGEDPTREGEFQRSPRSQSSLDGPVYKERPQPEADFGQTEG